MEPKSIIERKRLNAPTACTFEEIFDFISKLEDKKSPILNTTGNPGVKFTTEATVHRADGRQILLSTSGRNNQSKTYIYKEDWGYKKSTSNVRITHYMEPLDMWFSTIKEPQDAK